MTTKAVPRAPKTVDRMYLENRRLWTVGEFERAADLGAFGSDEKLELIEGEIIRKMTQKEPHAWCIQAVTEALRRVYATGHSVRVQLPLVLSPRNKPEPDVAVVLGSYDVYKAAHPTTAVLVVEISDTTLLMDQAAKSAIYARAGIPEYWIVNLPERLIEVYRQPGPMPTQPLGHGYRSLTRHSAGETVFPLGFQSVEFAVSDLLP